MKKPLIFMAASLIETGGIGYNNALPWNIPGDWEYFEKTTTKSYGDRIVGEEGFRNATDWHNVVIMGRRSFEAHPMLGIPLANRYNIVVSRNKEYNVYGAVQQDKGGMQGYNLLTHHRVILYSGESSNVELVASLEEAIARASLIAKDDGHIFILGGEDIYRQSLLLPECTHLLITQIHSSIPVLCDKFIPKIDPDVFQLAGHEELKAFLKDENIPIGKQKHEQFEYEFVLYTRKSQVLQ